jgi:hypothetical protein
MKPAWILPAIGLLLGSNASAQTLPQDRMRTGMMEVGARAWNVTLGGDSTSRSVGLYGISLASFVTDNISVGGLVAAVSDSSLADIFCLDAVARMYFFPLLRGTPWMELRLGGLIQPAANTGASHLGIGIGWRWRPLERLAIDLQIVGIERWGFDDPSEASNGTADWALQKGPLIASLSGRDGIRLFPVPSIYFLF